MPARQPSAGAADRRPGEALHPFRHRRGDGPGGAVTHGGGRGDRGHRWRLPAGGGGAALPPDQRRRGAAAARGPVERVLAHGRGGQRRPGGRRAGRAAPGLYRQSFRRMARGGVVASRQPAPDLRRAARSVGALPMDALLPGGRPERRRLRAVGPPGVEGPRRDSPGTDRRRTGRPA
jgi:hypothetical protein